MIKDKFENLVLIICEAVPDKLTTTRLNKLLWLIDKEAFLATGVKITECTYIRKKFGPVPKYNHDALSIMKDENKLDCIKTHGDGFSRHEYKAIIPSDQSVFSETEKNIIKRVLDEHKTKSTDKLIDISHDLSWAIHEDGEEIAFETYLSKINFNHSQKIKEQEIIDHAELLYEE